MDARWFRVGAISRRLIMVLAMTIGCLAATGGAVAGAVPAKVRFGGDLQSTRLVLDVAQQIDGRLVPGAPAHKIIVEFPRLSVDADSGKGQGLVESWTLAKGGAGARLTLTLAGDAAIDRRFSLPPSEGVGFYRYVIDLKPQTATGPTAKPIITAAVATTPVAAMPVSAPRAPAAPARAAGIRKVIVIDAGHGGHDSGALGSHVQEKQITLAAAKALKARLEQTGRYKVVLTRSGDTFIPLEDRVRIARDANADLFISLHADSGPAGTRGASVYTLSDRGSDRVAQKADAGSSNWAITAGQDGAKAVRQILFDLTQRVTRNKSAAFAETLIQEVGGDRPVLTRAHRDAGYVVLFAPDVPAVLLEMGFVTNPSDEALLTSSAQREALAASIARSIDKYFNSQFVTAAL